MKKIISIFVAGFVAASSFTFANLAQTDVSAENAEKQEIYFKLDFEDDYFGLKDPFDNVNSLASGNSITTSLSNDNRYMVFEKYASDYNYPAGTSGNANFRKIFNRLKIGSEDKITVQFDVMPVSYTDRKISFYFKAYESQGSAGAGFSVYGKKLTQSGNDVLKDGGWTTLTAFYDFSQNTNYLTLYAGSEEISKSEININKLWQIQIQAERQYNASKYNFDNFYIYSGEPIFDTSQRAALNYASAINADKVSVSSDICAISKYGDVLVSELRKKDASLVKEENNEIYLSVQKLSELLDKATEQSGYLKWNEALSLFNINAIYDERGFVYWSTSGTALSLSQSEIWNVYNKLVYDRPTGSYLASNIKKSHPRLNMTDGTIDEIKNNIKNNEYAKIYYEDSLSYVTSALNASPLNNKTDDRTIMMKARSLLNWVSSLALEYHITDNEDRKEKCKSKLWEHISAVLDDDNFPHWQPDSGLDNCEMTATVAKAYDWLYADWSDEQKRQMEEAIVNKGLKYADMHYGAQINSDHSWWMNSGDSNHNAVDNGGYILAALAVADKYPDLAGRVLERAIRSLEKFQNSFYPDGGWKEGVTYWVYSMQYWAPAVISLINSYGTDFGLSHSPGLEASVDFVIHACGLGANNFHDSGSEQIVYQIGSLYELAKIYNRSDFADIKLTYDMFYRSRRGLGVLINFPATAKVLDNISINKDAAFERIGLVSMRENWLDKNSMFVSFHGGDALPNHGHYDTGSFVYEYGGQRFAIDLPAEDYSFSDRSLVYRGRAEGHNCLVINPDESAGHVKTAFSPVETFKTEKYGAYAILNMTSAYSPYAASIKRGIKTEDNRNSAIIRDEITNLTNDSDIYWFMHLDAKTDVAINQDYAILTKDNVSIKLEFNTSLNDEIICVSSAQPLSSSPNPEGQSDNSAYKKIVIKGRASEGSDAHIQVKLSPVGEDVVPMRVSTFGEWSNPELYKINYFSKNEKKYAQIEIAENSKYAFVATYNDGELISLVLAQNNSYDGMSLSAEVKSGEKISTYLCIWESESSLCPIIKKIPIK